MKLDLGWGNSVAVREAFLNNYHGLPVTFHSEDLATFDYPKHEGDMELVELTRRVIKRQTDQEYKHVFLTNGATGGVVIALRAYAQQGKTHCITREAPYYVRYPSMIKASGLEQIEEGYSFVYSKSVGLLDLPSNPLGFMTGLSGQYISQSPMIIDGVYLNRVYAPVFYGLPRHDVMIGSYSKLLGINGIRVGWLATNDDLLAERFKDLVTSEYCGLSQASTDILKNILDDFDWSQFEIMAKYRLDVNREEWSKLERFFGGTPITDIGMFYYAPMDQKAQDLFTRANITWTKGSAMGTNDGFARFNMGAKNEILEQAVAAVLKADRR